MKKEHVVVVKRREQVSATSRQAAAEHQESHLPNALLVCPASLAAFSCLFELCRVHVELVCDAAVLACEVHFLCECIQDSPEVFDIVRISSYVTDPGLDLFFGFGVENGVAGDVDGVIDLDVVSLAFLSLGV